MKYLTTMFVLTWTVLVLMSGCVHFKHGKTEYWSCLIFKQADDIRITIDPNEVRIRLVDYMSDPEKIKAITTGLILETE